MPTRRDDNGLESFLIMWPGVRSPDNPDNPCTRTSHIYLHIHIHLSDVSPNMSIYPYTSTSPLEAVAVAKFIAGKINTQKMTYDLTRKIKLSENKYFRLESIRNARWAVQDEGAIGGAAVMFI